jgi:protein kinase-like protein
VDPLAGDDPVEIAGYRLRARLGSGGMGRVYLAFTPAGRPVALKVVRPDLGGDAEFRRRFRQEVDASRRVHGMYTAQVLDAGPDASPPWLVTAYVPGPSLHQAVAEHGPMPEQTVFVLLAGVAEALAAIHAAGIVHRDLKPSNVLLAPDGPRVIDFGIARAADSTVMTGTGMLIGSPPFMAPEQVKGQAVTQAVDVFALGAVAAFAATGRSPFGEGVDMGILYRVTHEEPDLSGCPPRLRELVLRCLAKDPAARPSPAEVIAACRAQPAGQPGETAPPWLPADVLAALGQHAPPPLSAPMLTHASTTPVAGPAAGDTVPPGGGAAPAWGGGHGGPSWGGQGATGGRPHGSGGGPVRLGPRSRPLVLGGVFGGIVVAALAVVGALALGGHGGNSPGSPTAGSRSLAATRQATAAAPSPTAKTSYAVDSCLVGNWKDAGDVLHNKIQGQQALFTGKGGGIEVSADGGVTQQFGPETLTATIDGNVWTEVLGGSAAMHATTSNGEMVFSDVADSPDAAYKLYENGVFDSTGPMSVSTTPTRYTCSPSTLRLYWSDGTSVYDRAS